MPPPSPVPSGRVCRSEPLAKVVEQTPSSGSDSEDPTGNPIEGGNGNNKPNNLEDHASEVDNEENPSGKDKENGSGINSSRDNNPNASGDDNTKASRDDNAKASGDDNAKASRDDNAKASGDDNAK